MKLHLLLIICLLTVLAECKWRPDGEGEFNPDQPNQFDSGNHLDRRRHPHDKGYDNKKLHHHKKFHQTEEHHKDKVYRLDQEYHSGKEYHHGSNYHHDKEFPLDKGYHGRDYHSDGRDLRRMYRDDANEVTRKSPNGDIPDPPDHTKLVPMARYVLHNADWASVATISVLPSIEGFPFSNVKSVVDGSIANSTGVPYFYMSPLDFTAKDLAKNSRSTILVSLEETKYCGKKKYDPEDPRCTRLMLSGKMKRLKEGTPEYKFAKDALFERHPTMADFPPDHHWFVAKLKIAQIAMVDWFGGAKLIPVRDYLAYNYTGQESLGNVNTNNVEKGERFDYSSVINV